ncbi:chromosomal replication initiator protein DnaA [Corynebacterium ulceribovis]|uniref:chromosomal replication initiator protein DnaA n=1 Tax=Corynebacterium ulceribovis TaxID=487732 RepID=UPI0003625EF4|nr:chromosomal replication initiator protein DnaA [Corynebacterium ulceribovis]
MLNGSADFSEIWNEVVAKLSAAESASGASILTQQQKAILALIQPMGLLNGIMVLAVPSEYAKNVVESQLTDQLVAELGEKLNQSVTLAISVDVNLAETPTESEDDESHSITPQYAGPTTGASTGPSQAGAQHGQFQPGPRSPQRSMQEPQQQFGVGTHQQHALSFGGDASDQHASGWSTMVAPFQQDNAHQQSVLQQSQQPAPPVQRPGTARTPTLAGGFARRESVAPQTATEPNLNPKYTFDSFVTGSSNRFAWAAAVAVAEAPAKAYNPLFISGGSGLGKTHLLHATGTYAASLYHGIRVKYVSSEEFTNDYINSVRDDRQESFKQRYRNLDILIVDDIQFLEGKEGTQEEFFHTFNALYQANKQIVLSSDRPPKQLTTLEDRLRTRFEMGLITDIQPPDLETRIAILSKKAQIDAIEVPYEVLELIASRFSSSIRELEGALIRVAAYASLSGQAIDLNSAEHAIRDLLPAEEDIEITEDIIIAMTAEYFGLTLDELCGPGKTRPIAHARQVSMYLCRELTDLSLPKIGQAFGKRDHTTVMYAERKIRKEMAERQRTYDQVQELTSRIKSRSRS